MIYKAACAVLLSFGIYIVLPSVYKIYLKKRDNQVMQKRGVICLTFDDGPDPQATPTILEILKEKDIRAVFFPIGSKVEKYPLLAVELSSHGHLVGEHSYSHIHGWKVNPAIYYKDLIKEKNVIDKYFGKSHLRFLRPTHGKINLITFLYTLLFNRRMVFWTLNSYDYKSTDIDATVEKILKRVKGGSVILFHDGRDISEEDPSRTVEILKALLDHEEFKDREFVTLDEVFL